MSGESNTALCVDLDGTLVRSDTLYESLLKLLQGNIFYVLLLPIWLVRGGRAHLKREIARRVSLDVSVLPYHDGLLQYLREQSSRGRPLVLATASDRMLAERVASHLNLFGGVIASDGVTNMKGRHKAAALAGRFGRGQFAYAGNDRADVPVWEAAGTALVVSDDSKLASRLDKAIVIEKVFSTRRPGLKVFVEALRLHQWVKNTLVFVPLFAAHRMTDLVAVGEAALAFLAFGVVASSGYLVNDMLDMEADRQHHRKRNRPFASGALGLRFGLIGAPLLLVVGAAISYLLPLKFSVALVAYLAASQFYSFHLKRVVLADVFTLAVLYTMRIIAGTLAIEAPISQWLLAFSVFLFLSLAFVKRCSELHTLRGQEKEKVKGRGYLVEDFGLLCGLGAGSGYIAVLVLALYINSPEVRVLYGTPEFLWMVCLVMLYWISRIWIFTHRGRMHDDPIVFTLKDRVSYLAGAICAAAVVAASV